MFNNFKEHSSKDNTNRYHRRNQRTESNTRPESAYPEERQLVERESKQPPNSRSARGDTLLPVPVELKKLLEERRKRNEQLFQRRQPSCGQFGVNPCRDKNNWVPSRNKISPKIRNKNRKTTKNVASNNRVETEDNPFTKKTVVITLDNSTSIEQLKLVMNFNKQLNEDTCPPRIKIIEKCEDANANTVSTETTEETDISNVSTEDKENENVPLPTDNASNNNDVVLTEDDKREEIAVSINSKKKDNSDLKRRSYEYGRHSKKLRKTTDCLSDNSTNTTEDQDDTSNTTKPKGSFVAVRNGPWKANFLKYVKPKDDSEKESSEHTESRTHAEYKERSSSNKHTKKYPAKYPKMVTQPLSDTKHPNSSKTENPKGIGETSSRSKPAQDKRLKIKEEGSLPRKFIENSGSTVNPKVLQKSVCSTEPTKTSSSTRNPKVSGKTSSRSNTTLNLAQQIRQEIKQEPDSCNESTKNSSNAENPEVVEESVCSNVSTKNPSYTKHPKMFEAPTFNKAAYLKMLERSTFRSKQTENYDNVEQLKVIGKNDGSKKRTESRSSTRQPKVFSSTTSRNPTPGKYPAQQPKRITNFTYDEYLKLMKAQLLADNVPSKHSTNSGNSFEQSNKARMSFPNPINLPEVQRSVKTCKDSDVSTLAKLHTEKNNDKKNPNKQNPSDTDSSAKHTSFSD